MSTKRPPVRVSDPRPILGWVEPLPDHPEPDPDPSPDDTVQLPAMRCKRHEREEWHRKAAARGVTLSQLIRDYLNSLP